MERSFKALAHNVTCGKNHVSFLEDGGWRSMWGLKRSSNRLAHLIKSCLQVLAYSPSVKSWPLTFQKSLMSTYKGFPLQQHVEYIFDWWTGHLTVWIFISSCWWSKFLSGMINTNLEMIHVVDWQVVQLPTDVCRVWRRARAQQIKQKGRWKHKAVLSHLVLWFKRSAVSSSESVPIVNSLFNVEISAANTLFRLPGTTAASETELVTATKYNTVLKALKRPHGQHISSTGLV